MVYASHVPAPAELGEAYRDAAYDSGDEARCAARTYAACLAEALRHPVPKRGAIDIGSGNGALLGWLREAGYDPVIGIEPSRAAIAAAPPEIRSALREGMFPGGVAASASSSLVCAFMILEHVADPAAFCRAAHESLVPGGEFAVVVHDRRAWINRLLGLRSPIMDVEHLQLFDPRSLEHLLARCGFATITVRPIVNRYPLRYWLRLSPLPPVLKRPLAACLERAGLDKRMISLPVGNLMAVAVKQVGSHA